MKFYMLHLHSYGRALVIVWSESRRVYSSVVVKGTVPLNFLFAPKHLVALEMVRDMFLAFGPKSASKTYNV